MGHLIINLFIMLFSLFFMNKIMLSEIKLYVSKYAMVTTPSENVSKENLQTGRSKF